MLPAKGCHQEQGLETTGQERPEGRVGLLWRLRGARYVVGGWQVFEE